MDEYTDGTTGYYLSQVYDEGCILVYEILDDVMMESIGYVLRSMWRDR
jgi:hypothetical protein